MRPRQSRDPVRCRTLWVWIAALGANPPVLFADDSPLPGYRIEERKSLVSDALQYEKHVRNGRLQAESAQGTQPPEGQVSEFSETNGIAPPSVIHVVRANLKHSLLHLGVIGQPGSGQTPSAHAANSGAQVLINGSFFDAEFRAMGLVAQNGRIWATSKDTPGYHVFGCTSSGDCAIENSKGVISDRLDGRPIAMALSGRPLLVRNGVARQSEEDGSCPKFCESRHPRSALGLDKERQTLILALVEGRRPKAGGLSLAELAQNLTQLGAFNAVNLDGGGSSTLVLEGKRASGRPVGDAQEREVVTALAIFAESLAQRTE